MFAWKMFPNLLFAIRVTYTLHVIQLIHDNQFSKYPKK